MDKYTDKQKQLIVWLQKGYTLGCHYDKNDYYWRFYLCNRKGHRVTNINGIIVRKLKKKKIIDEYNNITDVGKKIIFS